MLAALDLNHSRKELYDLIRCQNSVAYLENTVAYLASIFANVSAEMHLHVRLDPSLNSLNHHAFYYS